MPPTVLMPSSSSQTNAPINGQHFFPPSPSDARGPPGRHGFAISAPTPQSRQNFPPLPGFAPPVRANLRLSVLLLLIPLIQPHKFATYGIVPSEAASSEDESEDTLPRASLTAPIEALQGNGDPLSSAYVVRLNTRRLCSRPGKCCRRGRSGIRSHVLSASDHKL